MGVFEANLCLCSFGYMNYAIFSPHKTTLITTRSRGIRENLKRQVDLWLRRYKKSDAADTGIRRKQYKMIDFNSHSFRVHIQQGYVGGIGWVMGGGGGQGKKHSHKSKYRRLRDKRRGKVDWWLLCYTLWRGAICNTCLVYSTRLHIKKDKYIYLRVWFENYLA